jgi:uncharacterized protein YdeI (YjbR/CyaY-like superfamily)
MPPMQELPQFYAANRAEWRQWLQENHATAQGVWLIYFKKGSGKTRVEYAEAVEEALCFGWIDSVVKPIDEFSYKQLITPRKPKSNWSKLNKERVERLIETGLMTEAGFKTIEIAKQKGTWNALDEVELLLVPADLQAGFDNNPLAFQNWEAFSRSARRGILEWLLNAKRPETRAKRIEEIVSLAAKNIKANFPNS